MSDTVRVRLLFVDDGDFHHETVSAPADSIEGHDRLIDWLREDVALQKRLYVDIDRLVSAYVVDD